MIGQQTDLHWGQNWQSSQPSIQSGQAKQPNREVIDAYARQSVRIIHQEANQQGYASGTIVHTTPEHAYILTCGHIVKNGGQGLYVQRIGESRPLPAKLVSVSTKAELAALEVEAMPQARSVSLARTQPQRIVVYAVDGDHGQFHRHRADLIGTSALNGPNPIDEVAFYRTALHAGDSGGGCWDMEGNFAGVGSHVSRDNSESITTTTRHVREFLETCDWWRGGFAAGTQAYGGYGGGYYGGQPMYGGGFGGGYGGGYGGFQYQPQRLQTYGFIDIQPQFRSQPVFQGWTGRGEIFVGPQYQTYGGYGGGYGFPYGSGYGGYGGMYGSGVGFGGGFTGGGCPGGFCGYPQ
jgi:hypothetical protein